MGKINLELLKEKIKEKNAKWTAAKTNVSELSTDLQNIRLGLNPTDSQLKQIQILGLDTEQESKSLKKDETIKYETKGLPGNIDWRVFDGKNWTTPIKDQGNCGSCVAFGTIATLEELLKICYYKNSTKYIDLSEAHLLWCGGGSCNGWNMDEACGYLKLNGVPDESCFPYIDKQMSCEDSCTDWNPQVNNSKISSWSNTKDISTMKANLINNGPQITGMAVYKDFFNYKSGIYMHVDGVLAGYHCVNVVGYNDDEGYWICKNSWGTSWGEEGYFNIAYGECGIEDVFGMWDLKVEGVSDSEEGYVENLAICYDFMSSTLVLKAFANNDWRKKQLTGKDMEIAKLAFEANKVYVKWKKDQLTSIVLMKEVMK